MNLNEANHVITNVKTMLTALVDSAIIDDQDSRNLLPVIVQNVIKNEAVTGEYIEE